MGERPSTLSHAVLGSLEGLCSLSPWLEPLHRQLTAQQVALGGAKEGEQDSSWGLSYLTSEQRPNAVPSSA